MAEGLQDQERTEAATPRRREEARKQGQVAFSPDLVGAAVLFAGVAALSVAGGQAGVGLLDLLRDELTRAVPAEMTPAVAADLAWRLFANYARLAAPVMGCLLVVGVAAALAQVGFHLSPDRLGPNFERLSVEAGIPRLFSTASAVKGLLALLKVAVLGALAYGVLRHRTGVFGALPGQDLSAAVALAWQLVLRLALALAGGFLVIGLLDYLYQWYQFEQSIRMSRQEVRDELRREEGDPQLRVRRRKMQRELTRRRMLAEVPKATVVVTNPTHVAVALRYDRATMKAPRVVARGAGDLAHRIADAARRHAIPVVQRPVLARTLFRTVDVDREVPTELFLAVAEIIAFVYRLRGAAG